MLISYVTVDEMLLTWKFT